MNDGFGGTIGKIGPIILIGVLIGALLEQSGGAIALANRLLKWIGEKRVTWGMATTGYLVSIPVFSDSGFIILNPLNRALTKKAGLSLAGTTVALSMGLIVSHCLVPPTPGPIAAAELIGADIGMVIFWGIIVSVFALIPAVIFAQRVAAKTWIDPNPELSPEEMEATLKSALPARLAFLPIFVPILLIVIRSFNAYLGWVTEGPFLELIEFVGSPVIALLIGLAFALLLPQKLDRDLLSASGKTGEAVRAGAVMIIITGAGGVFGEMLRASSIADVIRELLGGAEIGIWLPMIVAAAIKTAQGSSTVAIVTTSAIVAPVLPELGLGSDMGAVLAVLAIGAGSMFVSHANDSLFWVVTQMTGMSVSQGFRLHTAGTAVLGASAALTLWVLSLFLL